ncbi:DsbE family thiol:disulfide interchange protein [Bartonella sp. CB169]|uniref:DsbE family thiol:disulfide interchange protein n=1 Tax=Bartonella sp. CB169 TaxID=3112257 RepID=UPI00300E462C
MKTIPRNPKKNVSLSTLFILFGPFLFFFLLMILFFYLMDNRHLNDISFPQNTLTEQPAPKISLPILGNENHLLDSEQFKGRITLVNFWGSWCLFCREEHPLLMKIAQDQRFDLVGINYKDSKENAQRFLSSFGNPFKFIGFDISGHTAINWGVYGAPETFLLNKDGIIIAKHVGPLTWQVYKDKILPKIKQALTTEETSNSKVLIHKNTPSFSNIE